MLGRLNPRRTIESVPPEPPPPHETAERASADAAAHVTRRESRIRIGCSCVFSSRPPPRSSETLRGPPFAHARAEPRGRSPGTTPRASARGLRQLLDRDADVVHLRNG